MAEAMTASWANQSELEGRLFRDSPFAYHVERVFREGAGFRMDFTADCKTTEEAKALVRLIGHNTHTRWSIRRSQDKRLKSEISDPDQCIIGRRQVEAAKSGCFSAGVNADGARIGWYCYFGSAAPKKGAATAKKKKATVKRGCGATICAYLVRDPSRLRRGHLLPAYFNLNAVHSGHGLGDPDSIRVLKADDSVRQVYIGCGLLSFMQELGVGKRLKDVQRWHEDDGGDEGLRRPPPRPARLPGGGPRPRRQESPLRSYQDVAPRLAQPPHPHMAQKAPIPATRAPVHRGGEPVAGKESSPL